MNRGAPAAGLYPLANGRTLCVVIGGSSEITVASTLALHTGLEAPIVPEWIRFDEADLLRFALHHEVAHCSDERARTGHHSIAYDTHLAENFGDAFAVLMHLRNTNDETLPHFFALMREAALVNLADREHMTVRSIDAALQWGLARSREGRLVSMDARSLLIQARELAKAGAYSRAEFALLASEASRDLHQNLFASRYTSPQRDRLRP
ncbi:MAG: hypothetical protein ACR2RL_23325 [Gammaproteobacteria bacterium]